MKKVLCIILALSLALSMTTSLVFADTSEDNEVSYTELDYSSVVEVDGETVTGTIYSNGDFVDTRYWMGNGVGASVTLEAGKGYEFSFTTTADIEISSDMDTDSFNMQDCIVVLTGGEFQGSYGDFNGDDFATVDEWIYEESGTISVEFVPTVSGVYRILGICYMVGVDEVDYEFSVTETDYSATVINELDYEWVTDPNYNNEGTIAIGPNGELAIADYYCEEKYSADSDFYFDSDFLPPFIISTDTDSFLIPISTDVELIFSSDSDVYYDSDIEENYYLRVYNPDGTLKFKAPLAGSSDCTPVFDENGNVYIASYGYSGMIRSSYSDLAYVYAFDTEGEPLWTVAFDYNYDFIGPMYVIDDVLVVRHYYGIMGLSTEDGSKIWEYNGLYCGPYGQADAGMGVYDGIIYLGMEWGGFTCKALGLEAPDTDDSEYDSNYYESTDGEVYYSLNYGLVAIDPADGTILRFIEDLDNCCGPQDSRFAFDDDGYLYFVVDDGVYVTSELDSDDSDYDPEYPTTDVWVSAPLYIVNTETFEYNYYDLDFSDGNNFVPYWYNGVLFITDNYGSSYIIPVQNGAMVDEAIPLELSTLILGSNEYALMDGMQVDSYFFDSLYIYDMASDNDGSVYLLVGYGSGGLRRMARNYAYLIKLSAVTDDDDEGLDVRAAVQKVKTVIECLQLKDGWSSQLIVTDTHVYVEGGAGDGIYAIRYADDPIVDTDSDTDEIGDDTDTGSGAGGDDTDIGGDTTGAEDTETETETDIDDYLKGDINGDGVVDVIDVALARAHIVGNTTLDEDALKRGDMNDDGILDIIDVVMIRKAIVEKK